MKKNIQITILNQKKEMELCPVCVRKLHENIQFDMLERYNALAEVCNETNSKIFKKDAELYSKISDLIKVAYGKNYLSKGGSFSNEETKDPSNK